MNQRVKRVAVRAPSENVDYDYDYDYDPNIGTDEMVVVCNARSLVFPTAEVEPGGVSYVRVIERVANRTVEIAYWTADEWRDEPEEVMGAILGALVGTAR